MNFFYRKPANPVLSKGGASRPPGGWPRLSKGEASLSPRVGGSPPAVVTTQEAPVAKEAAVAEAAVAEAVATPGRRGDVHGADYSRDRRRRGGISCWGCTEKHCTGHRACADCAGGDPAG